MKIALILTGDTNNPENNVLCALLQKHLGTHACGILYLGKKEDMDIAVPVLKEADAAVFFLAASAYGLPSDLLGFLSAAEMKLRNQTLKISAVIHDELYETSHCVTCMKMLMNWTAACGFNWCGGLGLAGYDTADKKTEDYIIQLSSALLTGGKNTYISFGNRYLYTAHLNRSYRKQAKRNGLEASDLRYRPDPEIFE